MLRAQHADLSSFVRAWMTAGGLLAGLVVTLALVMGGPASGQEAVPGTYPTAGLKTLPTFDTPPNRLIRPAAPALKGSGLAVLWPGTRFRSDAIRTAEEDWTLNPGRLWYQQGARSWQEAADKGSPTCATCHNAAAFSMRGVSLRYPRRHPRFDRNITLQDRINLCRTDHMDQRAIPYDDDAMLALTTYVRRQSLWMTIDERIERASQDNVAAGELFFRTKRGDAQLSCADCHETGFGQPYRGMVVSQGQPVAFPSYTASLGRPISLHAQFQRCQQLVGDRPLPTGAQAYTDLELYLRRRSAGLPVMTPGVRP
ncbi:MAG: sulfur oxidation c-type cytochrome SoxA [Pseudomonadota bacterium]